MRPAKLLPIIIIVSLLSGCGFSGSIYANYRAIERLQPVETLGVDAAGAAGVRLSVAGEDAPLTQSADSILAAMDALQNVSAGGELFFAHTRFLLLGEGYARAGVAPLLDYVERDMHLRTATDLCVLRGATAAEALEGAAEADVSERLAALKREVSVRGDSQVATLRETAVSLSEYGAALLCALERTEEGLRPAGYAVLRDGALVGYLDGAEAFAASLLSGHPGVQRRLVPTPAGGGAVLELDGAEAAFSPVLDAAGDCAGIDVRVSLRCALAELTPPLPAAVDAALYDALCAELSALLASELEEVLAQTAALDADVFGLAGVLRRKGAALPQGGPGALGFTVTVSAVMDRGSDLTDPVRTEGAGYGPD